MALFSSNVDVSTLVYPVGCCNHDSPITVHIHSYICDVGLNATFLNILVKFNVSISPIEIKKRAFREQYLKTMSNVQEYFINT